MVNLERLYKVYNALNRDFFNGALECPVINIISSTRCYIHYRRRPVWSSGREVEQIEYNLSTAFLESQKEVFICLLLREMCKQFGDEVESVQTVSRGGVYYNREFSRIADMHGLVCQRTPNHGWSDITSCVSDRVHHWIENVAYV